MTISSDLPKKTSFWLQIEMVRTRFLKRSLRIRRGWNSHTDAVASCIWCSVHSISVWYILSYQYVLDCFGFSLSRDFLLKNPILIPVVCPKKSVLPRCAFLPNGHATFTTLSTLAKFTAKAPPPLRRHMRCTSGKCVRIRLIHSGSSAEFKIGSKEGHIVVLQSSLP